MNIQWYPGHMTKARREMQESVKLIDLIIELTDARVPLAGRNPDIDELGRNKYRLIILNKADLSDEKDNRAWERYFKEQGFFAVCTDSRRNGDVRSIQKVIDEVCAEKLERDRRRGIKNRPIRAMIAGIPNVGKSTFINSFAGRSVTRTGNKPGVTRGKQWIRLNKNVELLDTPGILWPKFDDERVGLLLALVGTIRDEILPAEELSLQLIDLLAGLYPQAIPDRYQVGGADLPLQTLEEIARARGCIKRGEEIDYPRAAALLLDDFRSGRLGRISLEKAPEQ